MSNGSLAANLRLYQLRVGTAPWCSGLTCHPVTVEIAGSNPAGVASNISGVTLVRQPEEWLKLWFWLFRHHFTTAIQLDFLKQHIG